MTDHLRRIREHLALETGALLLEAERARLFDHNTNRGSEAEHSILRWLRARFAPGYTVSSGEIIDSFDTNVDLKSRQQDGVVHRNDADANRFLLPSGLRLVPIETVAAVVEVKLRLDKPTFDKADEAATETARLRLRGRDGFIPGTSRHMRPEERENGVPLNFPELRPARPSFSIFAFGGVKEIETIVSWLGEARTIDVVCCLEAGCVRRRGGHPTASGQILCEVSQQASALGHFGECIRSALDAHQWLCSALKPDFSRYAAIETLKYWEETGSYEHPEWYQPTDEELAARRRLYEARPALRDQSAKGSRGKEDGDIEAKSAMMTVNREIGDRGSSRNQ